MHFFSAECWGDLDKKISDNYKKHKSSGACITGDYSPFKANNVNRCEVHSGISNSKFVYRVSKYHRKFICHVVMVQCILPLSGNVEVSKIFVPFMKCLTYFGVLFWLNSALKDQGKPRKIVPFLEKISLCKNHILAEVPFSENPN